MFFLSLTCSIKETSQKVRKVEKVEEIITRIERTYILTGIPSSTLALATEARFSLNTFQGPAYTAATTACDSLKMSFLM